MNSTPSAQNSIPVPPGAFAPADDSEWFQQELQPHDAAVRNFVKHHYPAADADDVVQESYIKILRAKTRGKISSSKAFLYAVVRNTALSLLRKRKSYTETPLSEMAYLRVLDDRPDAAELVDQQHRLEFMKDAIQQLPPRCREVMRLALLKGKSNAEIAREMDIAEKTVQVQLSIAVKRCSDYVQQQRGRL